MNVVDSVIARNFRAEAEKARLHRGGFPPRPTTICSLWAASASFEFLKQILADYKIENNKFHIAGPSNGHFRILCRGAEP